MRVKMWITGAVVAAASSIGLGFSANATIVESIFTGEQDGVDLDIPFISFPGVDPDGGSIVNTGDGVDRLPGGFTLGSSGFTANFAGDGRAVHSGLPDLYAFGLGGRNFWGVQGEGVGVITFDAPARIVTLLARGTNSGQVSPLDQDFNMDGIIDFAGFGDLGAADGIIRAFTPDDVLIGEFTLSNLLGNPFAPGLLNMESFTFSDLIGRIELVNGPNADANSFALISFITATNIPEPASLALFGAGIIGIGALRRRRRTTGS